MAGGEQEEQAAERVQVGAGVGDAGAVRAGVLGGAVPGGAGVPGHRPGGDGEFEVDQAHGAVRADQHVAGGEVAQHQAAPVDARHQVEQRQRHRAGLGPRHVRGAVPAQPGGHPTAQRLPGDALLHQEERVLLLDQGVHPRCQAAVGQSAEQLGLVPERVAGVGAGPVDLDVRPGLLDHHLGAGGRLGAQEHAALGAVPQCGGERPAAVQQHPGRPPGLRPGLRRYLPGAGGRSRPLDGVDRPRRAAVGGRADVLDQFAVRAAQHRAVRAVVPQQRAAGERAVPVVHQAAGTVRAVGENRRPGHSGGGAVEFLGEPEELFVAVRIDGDEFPGRTPFAVAGIDFVQAFPVGGELERARIRGEHRGDRGQHLAGHRGGCGDVQLPALLGQFAAGRPDRAPEALDRDRPVAVASPGPAAGHGRPRHLHQRAVRGRHVVDRHRPPGPVQRCVRPHLLHTPSRWTRPAPVCGSHERLARAAGIPREFRSVALSTPLAEATLVRRTEVTFGEGVTQHRPGHFTLKGDRVSFSNAFARGCVGRAFPAPTGPPRTAGPRGRPPARRPAAPQRVDAHLCGPPAGRAPDRPGTGPAGRGRGTR